MEGRGRESKVGQGRGRPVRKASEIQNEGESVQSPNPPISHLPSTSYIPLVGRGGGVEEELALLSGAFPPPGGLASPTAL